MEPLRIALTTGEPAGIGPDLSVQLAQEPLAAELIAIGDPKLLADRADQLGLPLKINLFDSNAPARPSASGEICVMPVALVQPCRPGILDPANADYVLDTLALKQVSGLLTPQDIIDLNEWLEIATVEVQ